MFCVVKDEEAYMALAYIMLITLDLQRGFL